MTACSVRDTSNGGGAKEITFLVFETPNLTPQVWDAAIKRITDKNPDITVKSSSRPPRTGRRTPSSSSPPASSPTC